MESGSLANTELLRHLIGEIIRINITLQMYGVWHRDCKPENILYCKNDRSLRFIDFGSAAPVQSKDFREFQVRFLFFIENEKKKTVQVLGNVGDYGSRMDSSTSI